MKWNHQRKKTEEKSGSLEASIRKKRKGKAPHGGRRACPRYSAQFRLRVVKLYIEENYTARMISEEMGCCKSAIHRWVGIYRRDGEEGLRTTGEGRSNSRPETPQQRARREQVVAIKKENPHYGARRISDVLRRLFWIPASAGTVHKTLRQEELIDPPKKKRVKNPAKPRFFERSTPNQLWQSDIMSFRLGGKAVYLIGYIDDYSRYIVGLGLYRSQTGEAVLETYRRAVGDYGIPKEMLTDNGRQYATWRGKTKFQKELARDRIHHLRSQPHHPMTLGKIERFWKSILDEFLSRATLRDFEEARERIGLWVQYYNHRRPHQGIGGLCPADRYFEINQQIKQTLQAGIEENILETALRGEAPKPFYMVGRMGEQNVVIKAEKGQVRLLLDDEKTKTNQQLTYNLNDIRHDHESTDKETAEQTPLQRRGENPGGAGHLDRTAPPLGDLPGTGGHPGAAGALAKESDGGDPGGNGPAQRGHGQSALAGETGKDPLATDPQGAGLEACQAPEGSAGCRGEETCQPSTEANELNEPKGSQSPGDATRRDDLPGAEWSVDSHRGGQTPRDLPQDVLPVGEEGPGGADAGAGEQRGWPAGQAAGSRESPPAAREQPPHQRERGPGIAAGDQGPDPQRSPRAASAPFDPNQ